MIEPAGAEAVELMAKVHAAAMARPWSAAEIAKLMENRAVFALVSRDETNAVGFAMAWAVAGDSELLTVAVLPQARRNGAGAALVAAAAAGARARGAASMHLEVAEDNAPARALYAKLGYEEAGRRHAYYPGAAGPVDAIVMRRALAATAL